jgi:AcrR family transcriptional regulator
MVPAPHDQHGDVRRLVLDAALDIITSSGAESLSMREVARRAGVSHQAPYHYFGDRSGIFAAISEEGFSALAGAFRDVQESTISAAKAGFIAYLDFARSHVGHFRVMFRQDICGVQENEGTAIAASSAFDELLQMVARTIGSSVDPKAAHTFAFTMWSHAHGLATLVIDGPLPQKLLPGVSLDDQIDAVINLCSHMVALEAAEMGLVPQGH